MSELVLMKTPAGSLVPCDPVTAEYIARLKTGHGIKATCKKARNPKFHRKVFSLFNLAFDAWEAPELEYRGKPVAKSFNRFRKDLTILAGHYEAVTNIRGETRLEAKSLSFSSMEEDEFQSVYRDILNAVWQRVLKSVGYETPEQVDRIVEELLRYDQ
ncbi:DUF1367 family protein [Laribacter hongkongensis]|uniref:DUF1367 family protein n=1 Tax=Laribacter hongkongensis TaxID=168471 RepID=UPI001EFE89B2|nr:DUF1367 family protein [Laribacter hongkongensis]MCG9105271.1 DUF1367 family protein [Laribacter hongkongensis]